MSEQGSFKRITRASVKYVDSPVRLRIGTDMVLEVWKEGENYYLVEPGRAKAGKLEDCAGSMPLLNGASVVIGRQEISSECLDLTDSISRHHMLIKREFDMIYLFDLHSKNGTFLYD